MAFDAVPPLATLGPMRFKLTLAYDGTAFSGWQEQREGIRTVQQTVREALQRVVKHPVVVVGASRTDAGVHAKGQVAHFDTHMTQIPAEGMRRGLNTALPEDVLCKRCEPTHDTFDAISDARHKRYQYFFWDAYDRPLFLRHVAFHRRGPLDLDAMRRAAAALLGTHDFASFAKPGHGRDSTIRTVYACDVRQRGHRLVVGIEGNGFLWNQVRIMAGTLAEVGRGTLDADAIPAILAARDRQAAGPTAPAHGLFLQWIRHADAPAEGPGDGEEAGVGTPAPDRTG